MLYMCHDGRGSFFFTKSTSSALSYLGFVYVVASFADVASYNVGTPRVPGAYIYDSVYAWALESSFLKQSADDLRDAYDYGLMASVITRGGTWTKSVKAGCRVPWALDELKIAQADMRHMATKRFDATVRKFYTANAGLFEDGIADRLWRAFLMSIKPRREVCRDCVSKLLEAGMTADAIVSAIPELALFVALRTPVI